MDKGTTIKRFTAGRKKWSSALNYQIGSLGSGDGKLPNANCHLIFKLEANIYKFDF